MSVRSLARKNKRRNIKAVANQINTFWNGMKVIWMAGDNRFKSKSKLRRERKRAEAQTGRGFTKAV